MSLVLARVGDLLAGEGAVELRESGRERRATVILLDGGRGRGGKGELLLALALGVVAVGERMARRGAVRRARRARIQRRGLVVGVARQARIGRLRRAVLLRRGRISVVHFVTTRRGREKEGETCTISSFLYVNVTRRKRRRAMNLFRLLGDLSHLASILILLHKIQSTRSCRGISFKTQLLYLIVFLARWGIPCTVCVRSLTPYA